MLLQGAFLFNTAGGPGTYTTDVNFSSAGKAQYLAIGDVVTDRLGAQYSVTTWAIFPINFSSNGTVTVTPLGADVAPTDSLALGDASVGTPGQVNLRPQVQTDGVLTSSVLIEGRTYKYQCEAAFAISAEANKALVGDNFLDNTGRIFQITALAGQPGAFGQSFDAVEVDKIGDSPNIGPIYLYRGTPNFGFYQGETLNPLAEDEVRNRDEILTDLNLPHPSGLGSFLGLTDTPASYSGQAGQVVGVNVGESGLEFVLGGGGAGAGAIASGEILVISSASGNVTSDHSLVLVTQSGPTIVALQSPFDDGKVIYIKDAFDGATDRGINTITIVPPSGQTIDYKATASLVNATQSLTIILSSGVWYLV